MQISWAIGAGCPAQAPGLWAICSLSWLLSRTGTHSAQRPTLLYVSELRKGQAQPSAPKHLSHSHSCTCFPLLSEHPALIVMSPATSALTLVQTSAVGLGHVCSVLAKHPA